MSNILEELESLSGPAQQHFYSDHKREIHRAIQCGIKPYKRDWNPQTRWPWIRWGMTPPPYQPPASDTDSRLLSLLKTLEGLPLPQRHTFYRANRDEINLAYESLRAHHL